ncbi:BURP domain-containing protein 3 [Dendrobium catenatum]|uniref:BURP domain-containing protein 3 n=1 Tax=Dendrobium catenatum TaxID=906689 RepID=A0A2I0WW95_9ASPA|nr:BURP domain-containing protein 3 [Dendrobium catenatum]PKU79924.1 BURP domain-containing protein 3 [Dendrobium catenatum]
MGLFFPLLSSVFLFIIIVGANQANLDPQIYWRTILPHTPMPSAIEQLLQPDVYDNKPDTSVNVGKDGVIVNTGKGTSVNVGEGGVNVNTGKGTSVNVGPGGVGVNTGNSKPGGTTVGVGKGGVNVHTGKGTSVNVGPGGVGVNTGNSKPGDTTVGVGKGGVNVHTGKGTSVNVGPGGVGVNTGNSKPGDTTVGVGKGGVNVDTGKGTSVNVGHGGVGVQTGPTHKPGGTTVNVGKGGVGVDVKPKGKPVLVHVSPFIYNYAATDTQLHDNPAVALFFLRQDLRRGKQFTLQLAEGGGAAKSFIPRSSAESVPFSTAELPAILSRFSIPVGSAQAAATEKTLSECEAAPVAGEKKLCATSLESMVDFATTSLGTREVVAVATEGGSSAGERRVYKIGSVRTVAAGGGKGVVSCHPEAYAYAVFFCHATASSEVYEVEMAAEGGKSGVKAVAVCHTDTAGWNPNHLAFRVLNVKPGTVPVCHFLPQDHLVWAEKV